MSGPANADATRGVHFKALLHGRAAGYAIGLSVLGAATLAILLGNAFLLIAGPILVVAVVAAAFAVADKRAAEDFFSAFANAHGFFYAKRYDILAFTPLLGAGDRRHCSHYMKGPLSPDRPDLECALTNYTFEVKREHSDSRGTHTSWDPYRFTVCVVDLEAGISIFPGVFLTSDKGFFSKHDESNWLRGRNFRQVELESLELDKRYDLLIDPAQSEGKLRELFSPSLIVWLAGHPLKPCIEYRAGTLAVYVSDHLQDGGNLQYLLEATREITARFEAEIGERVPTAEA